MRKIISTLFSLLLCLNSFSQLDLTVKHSNPPMGGVSTPVLAPSDDDSIKVVFTYGFSSFDHVFCLSANTNGEFHINDSDGNQVYSILVSEVYPLSTQSGYQIKDTLKFAWSPIIPLLQEGEVYSIVMDDGSVYASSPSDEDGCPNQGTHDFTGWRSSEEPFLEYPSWSFQFSGSSGMGAVDYNFNSIRSKSKIIGIFTLTGQQLPIESITYGQIYVVRYADGSSKKVMPLQQ